jgi:hypothetical protein
MSGFEPETSGLSAVAHTHSATTTIPTAGFEPADRPVSRRGPHRSTLAPDHRSATLARRICGGPGAGIEPAIPADGAGEMPFLQPDPSSLPPGVTRPPHHTPPARCVRASDALGHNENARRMPTLYHIPTRQSMWTSVAQSGTPTIPYRSSTASRACVLIPSLIRPPDPASVRATPSPATRPVPRHRHRPRYRRN